MRTEMSAGLQRKVKRYGSVVNGIQYNLMSMDNWQADWARILGR